MIYGDNIKAREIIADGISDTNKWSHLWAMSKPRKTMEKTIVVGNSATMPLLLDRNKLALRG